MHGTVQPLHLLSEKSIATSSLARIDAIIFYAGTEGYEHKYSIMKWNSYFIDGDTQVAITQAQAHQTHI